ncbi:MAG TPA: S41 family peptidase [Rhizomicrobium sp.]|nr:S41 family peptidase [Rhizomicrobium sp.]
MALKRVGLTVLGAGLGFCAALAVLPYAYGASDGDLTSAYHELDRFGDAFAVARARYVEPPSDKTMVEGALAGMMDNLDPHSSYFDPRTFADMTVRTEGEYGGVGLVISAETGAVKVVAPMDDTPGSRAGIKAGDTITAIDGEPMLGKNLDQVQKKLRGPSGSHVTLTILREGVKDPFDVKLVRAAIQVEGVKFKREGDVGYIRVPAFNEQTNDGVVKAIRDLKAQIGPGIKGYVLDLRDDGGGVLDGAIGVAGDFLDGGEIVSTRGRKPSDTERYDAKAGDLANGLPVVVLINSGTASASEIVAGALQDHKRATIIGTTSFGKGSVQTIIPLDNGDEGALHMTTARYFTPSGRSIQATGIVPDIAVASGKDESDESVLFQETEAILPGHLPPDDNKPPVVSATPIQPDPGKKYDDFQLSYAVAFLDGKGKPSAIAARTGTAEDGN